MEYPTKNNMEPATTYFLEMLSPSSLRSKNDPGGLIVSECMVKQFQFNKFLYQFIGEKWLWTDKLSWADEQWQEYVERDSFRTWVAYSEGAVAGYYELVKDKPGNVEITYFGLVENFIGRGFGAYLLSQAIKSAWGWHGARRVWVHTCTLDHPGALQNYLARGMEIYREEADYRAIE